MAAILPAVAEPKRKATYDDVLAAPEHLIAEILEGELCLSPRPANPHTMASSTLGFQLGGSWHGPPGNPDRPGGWTILFEPELHLGADVVVPDLAGWRYERMPKVPPGQWIELVPDWVCETLSPATARIDRGRKLGIYAREGVAHLWLLDPLARTLEILRLGAAGQFAIMAVHTGNDRPHPEPFAATELDLARLWVD